MALELTIHKKLKEFDLQVSLMPDTRVFALMGPSGAGKSMILKCIAGIERPDAGRIVLDDRVLFDSKERICLTPQKRRVGYLFQSYALFPNMNVERNILSGLSKSSYTKKEKQDIAERELTRFHLEELRERYPRQLSGGQRQRVAFARLLAYDPALLLLDEPFAALDQDLKEELQENLKQLLQEIQTPAILVTHDSREASLLGNKIYHIKKGEIVS